MKSGQWASLLVNRRRIYAIVRNRPARRVNVKQALHYELDLSEGNCCSASHCLFRCCAPVGPRRIANSHTVLRKWYFLIRIGTVPADPRPYQPQWLLDQFHELASFQCAERRYNRNAGSNFLASQVHNSLRHAGQGYRKQTPSRTDLSIANKCLLSVGITRVYKYE